MTLGVLLQLIFGVAAAFGTFLANTAITFLQGAKQVTVFAGSTILAVVGTLPGLVIAWGKLVDGLYFFLTLGRFATSISNPNPVSLLFLLRPIQQLMFALSGIFGLVVVLLVGTGAFTAPLLLHVFPFIQDGIDEVWCNLIRFESWIDFILRFVSQFYNVIIPIVNYINSLIFEQLIDILKQLIPLLAGGANIILRIFFDAPSIVAPFTHNGQCDDFFNASLYGSSIEQLKCFVLMLLQFFVNVVVVNVTKIIPVIGPPIVPIVKDVTWLIVDAPAVFAPFIATVSLGLLGSLGSPLCITPALDPTSCYACSLGAPPGPPCCPTISLPCWYVRLFGLGQGILDIIFAFLESIPGIGPIIKIVAKLATILMNIFNKYIINPINTVLVAIFGALVAAINAFLSLICTIVRAFNTFCLGCVGTLGSGPQCGWQVPAPSVIIKPLTSPFPELSGISGLPAGLGGRRLLDEEAGSIFPVSTAMSPYDGWNQAVRNYRSQALQYMGSRKKVERQTCTRARTDVPLGLTPMFHDKHFALDSDGCPSWMPVLHSEVRHPEYPGYEAVPPSSPPPIVTPTISDLVDLSPFTGVEPKSGRSLLQTTSAVSGFSRIIRDAVLRAGIFTAVGLRMMLKWTVTTLSPALGILPEPAANTVTGQTFLRDFQAANVAIANQFHIPNRNRLGEGGSWRGLFDPRNWVSFIANDLVFAASGEFVGIIDISNITTADLDAAMKSVDKWANDLILNNIPALPRLLSFVQLILRTLLDLRIDSAIGLVAKIYRQIECDSPGTFDQRLRPTGVWQPGCLVHGQFPPVIREPIIVLPDNIVWGVNCTTGPLGCDSLFGGQILTKDNRCIACKCKRAGYALCNTVYASGMHLLSGLVSLAVEFAVSLGEGVASAVGEGSPNGLPYGIPQFINETVDLYVPVPHLFTINVTNIRLVALFPLLEQFLRLGVDPTGASICRAAFSAVVIPEGPGVFSSSVSTEPTIGLNAGVACVIVRLPSLFWALIILAAWVAAYFSAIVILAELGLVTIYLLYQVIVLGASLLAVWFVGLGRISMEHRIADLETHVGNMGEGGPASGAATTSNPLAAGAPHTRTLQMMTDVEAQQELQAMDASPLAQNGDLGSTASTVWRVAPPASRVVGHKTSSSTMRRSKSGHRSMSGTGKHS